MGESTSQSSLTLGTAPVGKLLLQYSVPAIIASIATSLYNIIDSIFIGQGVGAMAISELHRGGNRPLLSERTFC